MTSHSELRLACLNDIKAWTSDLESKLGGVVKTGFNVDMEGEVPFIRCSIPMMVLAGDWVWEPRWYSYIPPHVQLWLSLTDYVKEGRVKERLRRVFSHRIVETFPYGASYG